MPRLFPSTRVSSVRVAVLALGVLSILSGSIGFANVAALPPPWRYPVIPATTNVDCHLMLKNGLVPPGGYSPRTDALHLGEGRDALELLRQTNLELEKLVRQVSPPTDWPQFAEGTSENEIIAKSQSAARKEEKEIKTRFAQLEARGLVRLKNPPAITKRMKKTRFVDGKLLDKPVDIEVEEVGPIPHAMRRIEKLGPNGEAQYEDTKMIEILLPMAGTGFYLPSPDTLFNRTKHKALLILMPGIGSTQSHAMTVTRPALAFTNRGYFTMALDMPLNGMGSDAPGSFATAEGTLQVLRHAQLIFQFLYPGLYVGVGGRSQGGVISQTYGERYDVRRGLFAAFAINPSPVVQEIHNLSIDIHENPANVSQILSGPVALHDRAWASFRAITPDYVLHETSLVPTLVHHSPQDRSYPQDLYIPYLKQWQSTDPAHRQLISVEVTDSAYGHDLWSTNGATGAAKQAAEERRERVLSETTEFLDAALERAKRFQ